MVKEATQYLFQYKHRPHVFQYFKDIIYFKPHEYPLTEGIEFTCEYILNLLKEAIQKYSLTIKLNETFIYLIEDSIWFNKIKYIAFKIFAWRVPYDISCHLRGISTIKEDNLLLSSTELYYHLYTAPLSTYQLIETLRPKLIYELQLALDELKKWEVVYEKT